MKRSFFILFAVTIVLVNTNAIAQTSRISNSARSRVISTPGQLQGTILFTDNNALQQLEQELGANIAQAAGNQIKVELWQVNYVPDKSNSNFTDILLTQKLDANVSYQPGQNSIGYSLNYRPVTANVAIIAYWLSAVQRGNFRNARTLSGPNAKIRINGKPNDGAPASMAHQFKSDAKKYLGDNIIYGIYSLPPGTSSFSNADFRVAVPSDPYCKNCDWVSDAWNAVEDLANQAAKFVKATVDAVGNAAGDAVKDIGESILINNGVFYVECFGEIATLLQTGNMPKIRMLSDYGNGYAYNFANSLIFMNTLPPVDKIIVTNLMSIDRRAFTVPIETGGTVYILMNLGDAFDDPVNHKGNGFAGDVFIHELTHAWQIWHIDNLRLFADGAVNQFKNTVISNQYRYDCDGHNMTDSYNEEQQAMIVENFYSMMFYSPAGLLRADGSKATCGFEQQWTVQNILGNQPANINGVFTATSQMVALSQDPATIGYTGGVADRTLAIPSNGNKTDGTGFYLQGKSNNSVYYYSNKTRTVSANWGPVRDKFVQANYEFGELGWPETTEAMSNDRAGFWQKFDHGFIYWHPKTGAHIVLNKIYDAWKTAGLEAGRLGYPISEYFSLSQPTTNKQAVGYSDKGYQKFAGGVIFYDMSSLNAMAARGDQNFTTIGYGDPDRLVEMHYALSTTPRRAEGVAAVQQPQPSVVKQSPGSTIQRRADAVQLNPQPLPPKVKTAPAKKPQPTNGELNPQPLPPKN